ncbi:PEP-CTERM sorting domain-containing protein [Aerophototrophica crusticola]|uniref:PEP-CTERM sorting domain-containing protein n=1 Tax=Aerophototrophica crusticola TaxID=1709002 RepID=A0A858R9M7_9PROT|nr:PEP-CTERM sorting domain-containing protein [Rhodospirillaceae bacterium B3]
MKKTLLTLAGALAFSTALSAPAAAIGLVDIYVSPPTTEANKASTLAKGADYLKLLGLQTISMEDFETYTPGSNANSINTKVGTFTGTTAGQNTGVSGLRVLNAATRPKNFGGRYDMVGGANWLDSNDYKTVTWDAAAGGKGFTHVGFYLTDVNDVSAKLKVKATGQTIDMPLGVSGKGGSLDSGTNFFVGFGLGATYELLSITFTQTAGNDGFGIDGVVLAQVPEPATLGLLGAGLLAAGALRRRRKAA